MAWEGALSMSECPSAVIRVMSLVGREGIILISKT
jgi:hypothetical protein